MYVKIRNGIFVLASLAILGGECFSKENGETIIKNESRTSTKTDESAVLANGGEKITVEDSELKKTGDASNPENSNFFGTNAVVLSKDGTISVERTSIESNADGANAVFSTGENSFVIIKNSKIRTKGNSSRGLDATYKGKIVAYDVEIETDGEHCAALATDRGEGTVSLIGGKALTKGRGSPVIYSTGDIRAKNLEGKAYASEIACIEGKNSIVIEKSRIEGGGGLDEEESSSVMLYQSMSGDADEGTASFAAKDSELAGNAKDSFFYVTNTNAKVSLSNTKISNAGRYLVKVAGNDSKRGWGRKGSNGGNLEFKAENQKLFGEIVVDGISSMKMTIGKGALFEGKINVKNEGEVNLTILDGATLKLTGDIYINAFSDSDSSFKNIVSNGHTIFYNKKASENAKLGGKTIALPDGGKLQAYEKEFAKKKSANGNENGRPKMPGEHEKRGELEEFTGELAVVGKKALLFDENNKSLELKTMENGGKKQPKGNGNGGMMPPPDGDMQQMNGNPPPMPNDMGNQGNPGKDGQKKNPPKLVKFSDLKKLNGKKVVIKGVKEKDGTVTVFEVAAVK